MTLAERAKLLGVTRQRVWQLDRSASGDCPWCGKKNTGGGHACPPCMAKNNDHVKARYRLRNPGAMMLTCGLCGGLGHNRRSHKR